MKASGRDSSLSTIVHDLKATHFELGRNGKDNFGFQTNKLYGANQTVDLSRAVTMPWA